MLPVNEHHLDGSRLAPQVHLIFLLALLTLDGDGGRVVKMQTIYFYRKIRRCYVILGCSGMCMCMCGACHDFPAVWRIKSFSLIRTYCMGLRPDQRDNGNGSNITQEYTTDSRPCWMKAKSLHTREIYMIPSSNVHLNHPTFMTRPHLILLKKNVWRKNVRGERIFKVTVSGIGTSS